MARFNRIRFQEKMSKRRNILRSKNWHFHEITKVWHNSAHTKEVSDRMISEMTTSVFLTL